MFGPELSGRNNKLAARWGFIVYIFQAFCNQFGISNLYTYKAYNVPENVEIATFELFQTKQLK